jgi:hypothetical protein
MSISRIFSFAFMSIAACVALATFQELICQVIFVLVDIIWLHFQSTTAILIKIFWAERVNNYLHQVLPKEKYYGETKAKPPQFLKQ